MAGTLKYVEPKSTRLSNGAGPDHSHQSEILLLPLEVFLKRTIFTQTLIEHRTMFGVKTAWEYSSVEKFLLNRYLLKICFQNGRKVSIWSSTGDLERVISIIQERVDKSIPIEPSP
jgi:hypothetical protein